MTDPPPVPTGLAPRIRDRNRSHRWWLRAPLLVWFVFTFRGLLDDPGRGSLWSGMNLAFHEIGHILFLPFPDLLTVAGGTLTELAVPIVAGLLLVRQKDDFGGALALFWLGTALVGVATYAGDARAQQLPIVSPFPGPVGHDWNHMLGALGLLQHDATIADALRTAGYGAMGAGILSGAWIVWLMATDVGRASAGGRKPAIGALEREDVAFRAWWARQEAEGAVPPMPGGGDRGRGRGASPASDAVLPDAAAPQPDAESGSQSELGAEFESDPGPGGSEPDPDTEREPERDGANEALAWLDRKEAEEGLSQEEARFREWLRRGE